MNTIYNKKLEGLLCRQLKVTNMELHLLLYFRGRHLIPAITAEWFKKYEPTDFSL